MHDRRRLDPSEPFAEWQGFVAVFAALVEKLDSPKDLNEVGRELDILEATLPPLEPTIRQRELIELKVEDLSSWFPTRALFDKEDFARACDEARVALAQGTPALTAWAIPKVLSSESPLIQMKATMAGELLVAILDLQELRTARLLVHAKCFALEHARWPSDLCELLHRPPGLAEANPFDGAPPGVQVDADGNLCVTGWTPVAWVDRADSSLRRTVVGIIHSHPRAD